MKRMFIAGAVLAALAPLGALAPASAAPAAPAVRAVLPPAAYKICDTDTYCLDNPGVPNQVRTSGSAPYGENYLGTVAGLQPFSHSHWNTLYASRNVYQLRIDSNVNCLQNLHNSNGTNSVILKGCANASYDRWVRLGAYWVNVRATDLQDAWYPTGTVMDAVGPGNQPVWNTVAVNGETGYNQWLNG